MKPKIVIVQEKKLVGVSMEMSLVDNKTFELWNGFRSRSNEIQQRSSQDFISLQYYPKGYFEAFKPSNHFLKWACVEVSNFKDVPYGMESFLLPAGSYAVFDHKGSSADPGIFQYIYGEWIPKSSYQLDDRPHFEVLGATYKTNDPTAEEQIWIPIRTK